MARRCDICGKGTVAGQVVPRKGQAKKDGGVGQHIGVTKKREFRPNLVTMVLQRQSRFAHVVLEAESSRK